MEPLKNVKGPRDIDRHVHVLGKFVNLNSGVCQALCILWGVITLITSPYVSLWFVTAYTISSVVKLLILLGRAAAAKLFKIVAKCETCFDLGFTNAATQRNAWLLRHTEMTASNPMHSCFYSLFLSVSGFFVVRWIQHSEEMFAAFTKIDVVAAEAIFSTSPSIF